MRRFGLVWALGLGACGDAAGLGVGIYGEVFIEEGIPAEVFADGWSVEFERFLVSVGEVTVAEGGRSPGLAAPQYQVYDLAQGTGGAGHAVAHESVPEGRYDHTGYVIGPADDAVSGSVQSSADVEVLRAGGYSVYVEGIATKGEIFKTFAWGFATRTRHEGCMSLAEIHRGGPAEIEITIHGDHLFFDDLFSATPAVRFERIAQADDEGDGDGDISRAELAAVDIRPLANYQVGSTGIEDLWRFIEQQVTTIGHIDGEGHCETVRLD